MKKLIVFDFDGTVAESKSPLDTEMTYLQASGDPAQGAGFHGSMKALPEHL